LFEEFFFSGNKKREKRNQGPEGFRQKTRLTGMGAGQGKHNLFVPGSDGGRQIKFAEE